MDFDTMNVLKDLISSIVYVILWIGLMFISFFILEKITSFSIKKELVEDENIAIWVMFAWFFIATWIIIGFAIAF